MKINQKSLNRIILEEYKDLLKEHRLLLERTIVPAQISPDDFLALTTDANELKRIMTQPSIKEPFDAEKAGTISLSVNLDSSGNAKVIEHEGRNRSFAAKKAGLNKLPLNIIVVNREGTTYGDIKQFIGQMSPVVIPRSHLWTRDATFDTKDPLRIGDERSIKSYIITDKYGIHDSDGLIYFLNKKFNSDNALHNLGFDKFIESLNKSYIVTDSSGKEYTFIKNRMYPHSNQKSGGFLYLNLLPHPIEVHGTLEAANEQTYTIKKKSVE